MVSGGIAPHINFGNRRRWVVSCSHRLLYTPGGPQSRSGRSGEEKKLWSCRESNHGRPANSLVTILTELFRLLYLLFLLA